MERKDLFVEFFIFLILFIFITILISSINAKAEMFTVNDDGNADFRHIQDAINYSETGDTIFVYNGIYYEHIVINKSINLIGENNEKTIVDGAGKGTAINVTISWVNITGFTITNAGDGIKIYNSTYTNISHNRIENNFKGIWIGKSHYNNVFNNTVSSKLEDIVVWNSSYNNFVDNNVTSNSLIGFEVIQNSSYNIIVNNTISTEQTGIMIGSSYKNIVLRNLISLNEYTGIWISNAEYNNVTHNKILYNDYGIFINVLSNENNIKFNNISFNEYGMHIELFTKNNTVTHNTLFYNDYGIYMVDLGIYDYDRTNNTINNNTMVNNKVDIFRDDIYGFDYLQYVIGFGSIILVSTTIFTAGTEIGKYKFLFFFFPLYNRLNKDNVLDHYTRGEIHGYIIANPGVHYNIIKRKLKLKNGTLAYHLRVMEREDIIKSKRDGFYKRFFPYELTNSEIKKIEDDEHKLGKKHKKILEFIREKPGITQKDIIQQTNYTQPTVNYNIQFLVKNDLIYSQKEGREIKYFLKSIE